MGTHHGLHHRKPEARALGAGGEEGFEDLVEQLGRHPLAIVEDAHLHPVAAAHRAHQERIGPGLPGVGDQVVDGTGQRTAVGEQTEIRLRRLHVQRAALLLAEGLGTGLHLRQQPLYRDRGHHLVVAVAGKQQDVVYLLLEILQASHQLLLELGAGFRFQGAVREVGRIEHGGGEGGADLVRQGGRHVAQGRQPFHVVDPVLQLAGLGRDP